jgi:hypothetical protein
MSDRVSSPPSTPAPAQAAPEASPTSDPREALWQLKHCWVVDEHGRLPALLLGWRRLESGFQGRVIRPVWETELGWVVVEEWLPAQQLEPA